MKKLCLLALILITFLSLGCKEKKIIDTEITIYGTVTEEATGATISGATVTLKPEAINVYTGNDGSYRFTVTVAKDYNIWVSKDGYQTDNKQTNVLVAGESYRYDFSLKKNE
jgi:hypothetical protein